MSRFRIPSISFSGAGFLGAYHAGVYSCLLKHGYLLKPLERVDNECDPPILTGVSAGSLISGAISAGVAPHDVMDFVLTMSKTTRAKGGFLDVLAPGYSLIDEVSQRFELEMQKALGGSSDSFGDYDNDLLMNRIQKGRLRIGLTDRIKFQFTGKTVDLNAYAYVDEFRNVNDIKSACILSSYIPFGTGPLDIENESENLAAKEASDIVKCMDKLGFVKHPGMKTDDESKLDNSIEQTDLRYLDGGLVNMFPVVDKSTVIISPINGTFLENKYIAPSHPTTKFSIPDFQYSDDIHFRVNTQNILALYQMAISSSSEILHEKFRGGYDDATKFLDDNSLLTVFENK